MQWVMAVYFPRGPESLRTITAKLIADAAADSEHTARGLVLARNQELKLAERTFLERAVNFRWIVASSNGLRGICEQPSMISV
jgi:hypothetical protein